MQKPEIPMQQFTAPKDWRKESGRIFPPAEGRAFERAVIGMNRLENIKWPNVIPDADFANKKAYLSVLGQEFISHVLEEHPNLALDVGFKRHQRILQDLRKDINETASTAPQLVYSMIPDNEEEVRQAILAAEREKDEKDAATSEATRIIMRKANPPSKGVSFIKDRDRHNTERLSREGHILLNTAQDFLLWETFADRKGYGEMPNVWEILIDMYILGMESFYIDPDIDQFTVTVLVNNGKTERETFEIPRP